MKKLTKVISSFLAATMFASSMTAVVLADTTSYDKNGDFATNGAFPETGVILDWGYYARPAGMSNMWATVNYDGHQYANDTSKSNPRFHFEISGSTVEGGTYWTDASKIETGVLEITNNVFVPELKNADSEQYVQYFYTWSAPEAGETTKENGNLYSVIMNDSSDVYVGFTTKCHHDAVIGTNTDEQPGTVKKISTKEWHKLSAIINYDAKTMDYYLDDEYVGSHEDFANNSEYYQMGSLYYDIGGSPTTNNTHVYVTGTKMERFKPGTLPATASLTSNNTVRVAFDEQLKTVANDSFVVKSADGTEYEVASATLTDDKTGVDITVNGSFNANEAVSVVANGEIVSRTASTMPAGTSLVAVPLLSDSAFINMDFDNTAFPTNIPDSTAFTAFYGEYPQQVSNNTISSDFADAKAYLDAGDNYYMGYTYSIVSPVSDSNGGKALSFHRYTHNTTAKAWSTTATDATQYTYGLVIPFSNGKSVNSGKINIEFDGGKVGTVNADAYTIGLRDKNNPITEFSKTNAWSNSTALFTFGDYYETATIIYKPQGKSAGYSYYAMNKCDSPSVGNYMWPNNASSVTYNNAVRHYKVELDFDTKTYDIYQDNEKIGEDLSLQMADNAEYDAFVIGCGLNTRDNDSDKAASFYLDNLVIENPDATPLNIVSIDNADSTSYTGNVVDNTVVFNFNKYIQSVAVTVGTTAVTPTIEGSKVTVSLDGIAVNGSTTITLSNITATDETTIDELKIPAVIPAITMSGSFSETPDGLTLSVDDGGYTGNYTIYVAGYDTTGSLLDVEVLAKGDGTYALTRDFSTATKVRAYIWGDNLEPLTSPIIK